MLFESLGVNFENPKDSSMAKAPEAERVWITGEYIGVLSTYCPPSRRLCWSPQGYYLTLLTHSRCELLELELLGGRHTLGWPAGPHNHGAKLSIIPVMVAITSQCLIEHEEQGR